MTTRKDKCRCCGHVREIEVINAHLEPRGVLVYVDEDNIQISGNSTPDNLEIKVQAVSELTEEEKAARVAPTITVCDAFLEEGEVIGKTLHEYVNEGASSALEKLYRPDWLTPNFMGLKLDEQLSSRALMAVIQQLSMMAEYEKMFQTCGGDNENA
ncbi:MAG: hypothetical protein DRH97_00235 [Chloroflexi bacterium]|nr:MAG: hypothetical protein DRH97_00235 [Chloroflexota bacterium]